MALITSKGMAMLEAQLDQLWNHERPKIAQGVADAAAEGDRSENAEYIYGKKKLREIDRKVGYLNRRLKVLKVVDPNAPRADAEKVYFSAMVEVLDEDDETRFYRIVGADESQLYKNGVSVDSPVAKALMGKRIGDEVTLRRPKGDLIVEIVSVEYGGAE